MDYTEESDSREQIIGKNKMSNNEIVTMEEFISNNLPDMLSGYKDAIIFTESGVTADAIRSDSKFSEDALKKITVDCKSFLKECWKYNFLGFEPFDAGFLGHNFWLNRNGHGSGFWDNEDVYGEIFAEKLSKLSETYKEQYAYLGDSGLIEIE